MTAFNTASQSKGCHTASEFQGQQMAFGYLNKAHIILCSTIATSLTILNLPSFLACA